MDIAFITTLFIIGFIGAFISGRLVLAEQLLIIQCYCTFLL